MNGYMVGWMIAHPLRIFLQHLDSLVRQPTGCGEQNMVLFAPNIHVMNYLVAVDELTETYKDKIVKHMKSGAYNRQHVLEACLRLMRG